MTSSSIFSCLLFSFWPVGRTVAHWSSIRSFEQILWFSCTVGAFLEPVLVCVSFTHFVIIYQSEEKIKAHHLYAQAQLEWTCDWGDFITISLFSKPTLWLADLSQVFCVKCEGSDSPLLPPPAPTESGRLFNAHRPTFPFCFFPVSDVRLCTDIHTQCRRWVLKVFIFLIQVSSFFFPSTVFS